MLILLDTERAIGMQFKYLHLDTAISHRKQWKQVLGIERCLME